MDELKLDKSPIAGEIKLKAPAEYCDDAWQDNLAKALYDLAESFLDFYPGMEEFEEQQFARHLLWRLDAYRGQLSRAFRHHAMPSKFDHIFAQLLPYVAKKEPDEITEMDGRFIRFCFELFLVTKDYIVTKNDSFDHLMERIIKIVRKTRAEYNS